LRDRLGRLWAFSRRTLHQADRHRIPFLASALTFDALLAAIPFLLLVLVGLTHAAELSPYTSPEDLQRLFTRFVPHVAAAGHDGPFEPVSRLLMNFVRARGTVSLYALPLFLWFSTRLFASIRTALTLVYDVPQRAERRHFLLGYLGGKLRDAIMVGVTVALIVTNVVLTAGLKVLNARSHLLVLDYPALGFLVTAVGRLVAETVAFGFSIWLFYLVYRHASPRRLPRRAAIAGSVFSAVLFEVAKRAFGWYLRNLAVVGEFAAGPNIAALLFFVLWAYYTALVFLLGAVVAETWDLRSRLRSSGPRASAPHPAA